MPYDNDIIIDRMRKEAIARCRKRIEEAAADKKVGINRRTYARQDYGLMMTYKKSHGL